MISIRFGGPNTTPTRINYAGDVDAHIDGIFNWSMLPRYIHTHTHTDTRMTSIPVLPVRRYFYAEKRLENLIKPMCCRFNWMPCPALSMGRYSRSAGSCAACTHTIYMQMQYSAAAAIIEAWFTQRTQIIKLAANHKPNLSTFQLSSTFLLNIKGIMTRFQWATQTSFVDTLNSLSRLSVRLFVCLSVRPSHSCLLYHTIYAKYHALYGRTDWLTVGKCSAACACCLSVCLSICFVTTFVMHLAQVYQLLHCFSPHTHTERLWNGVAVEL